MLIRAPTVVGASRLRVNERWNNKFYYKVASCWLFLLSPADVFTRSSFQLNLHLLMYSYSIQQVKEFIITRKWRRHGCKACHLGDSDVTPEAGECHCVSFMTHIFISTVDTINRQTALKSKVSLQHLTPWCSVLSVILLAHQVRWREIYSIYSP